ncbi:MAG: hypothetical protein ACRDMJ_01090 [Solirubrobacteraceae bacterium]
MSEIRIDPLSGYRSIVADGADGASLLGPEAVEPPASAIPDLFWAGAARGAQEAIEPVGGPVASLADLEPELMAQTVEFWRERMRAHKGTPCLHLTVDEDDGGSRALLYALDFVPAAIARERERFGAYATRTMGGNLLGDLVQQEVRLRERLVAVDREAVLLAAYAPRAPYQMMVVPRTPRMRFEDDGPTGAAILQQAIGRLARLLGPRPPLSLWVRTAPRGADHFCWRIDIVPRLEGPRGLELGTGLGVAAPPPETAAAHLRDAAAHQPPDVAANLRDG